MTQKQEDWTHADGLDGEVAEGTQGRVAAEGEPEGSLVGQDGVLGERREHQKGGEDGKGGKR